jgi:HlyD family secretion protein
VVALGRLEPKDEVIRVAGPSLPVVVISELRVEEGDWVEENQILAVLDTFELTKTTVARLEAELRNAEVEYQRNEELYKERFIPTSQRDSWQLKVDVARADLKKARAELARTVVRSPIKGQVLQVHARAGEKVGPDGIVELGKTQEMYAIAEVYETDIARVKVGQRATVTSPALAKALEGTVERIGIKVGKMDVLGTDPAAKTDARVIEVEVRLDDSEAAACLTNLTVEIAIAL